MVVSCRMVEEGFSPKLFMEDAKESNDTFCSLDMLAEVASATLQNDPTLISNRRGKGRNSKASSGNASRKHASNSEKLTLDQIKVLSEKMLIDMFSELICDEMRKNYSFKCFLIPDKCSQIFKSFGSEARARCKMKAHLQSHISELLSEENVGKTNVQFTAEPLHVRRKRLRELNAKSVRKRKRSKLLYSKKKKDSSSVEYFHNEDFKTVKPRKTVSSAYKNSKNSAYTLPSKTHKYNCNNDFVKCTSTNFNQDLVCSPTELLPLSPEEAARNMKQITLPNYFEDGASFESETNLSMGYKIYPTKKKKGLGSNSTHSEYVVKWNVDFDDASLDDSHFSDYDVPDKNSEAYLGCHHDHIYTSIHGKTFDLSRDDIKKSLSTIRKDKKQSHQCTNDRPSLIISTPPFPFVYIPLLPHVAQVLEIGKKASCKDCIYEDGVEHFCETNMNTISPAKVDTNNTMKLFCDDDDDDNSASNSYFEDNVSESESFSENTDSKMGESAFDLVDVFGTECAEDLQPIEKVQ